MNIFSDIVKGLTWLGKEILDIPTAIKRVITITDDVKADADTLLPDLVSLVDATSGLVTAAVKDSGADITALEALVAAVVTAAKADALNVESDEGVLTALKAFIAQATASTTYTDVLTALGAVTKAWDALGVDAKASLQKLEADV